jgi:glyoxylase-like metal-dependent hydrolase (beta-lactamase superfamily II)
MATPSLRLVDRRWFLTRTGRGALGVAVLGLAACSSATSPGGGPATTDPASGSTSEPATGRDSATPDAAEDSGEATTRDVKWSRVDLGFVSAYVLVRGREAAVVDTGVGGSADAIGTVLRSAGSGWAAVRHVVLTHKHPDHAGSVGDVLTRATSATGYVGRADLPEVDAPRPLTVLEDGDDVLGLRIVATPGHTAGHLAAFDEGTGVLVAGDALNNDGGLSGSNPQFTEDEAAAAQSVRTLARLAPSVILVGHGPPVLEGASDALEELAASLG